MVLPHLCQYMKVCHAMIYSCRLPVCNMYFVSDILTVLLLLGVVHAHANHYVVIRSQCTGPFGEGIGLISWWVGDCLSFQHQICGRFKLIHPYFHTSIIIVLLVVHVVIADQYVVCTTLFGTHNHHLFSCQCLNTGIGRGQIDGE